MSMSEDESNCRLRSSEFSRRTDAKTGSGEDVVSSSAARSKFVLGRELGTPKSGQ